MAAGATTRSPEAFLCERLYIRQSRALRAPSYFVAAWRNQILANPGSPRARLRLLLLLAPLALLAMAGCEAARFTATSGWSGAVVAGDAIYIGSRQAELLALDKEQRRSPVELPGQQRRKPGRDIRQPRRDGKPDILGRLRRGDRNSARHRPRHAGQGLGVPHRRPHCRIAHGGRGHGNRGFLRWKPLRPGRSPGD